MEKLSTIQKRNNLNDVYRLGPKGPGGAHHEYAVYMSGADTRNTLIGRAYIAFQKGPRKDPYSTQGVLDTDLLEIVRDRLKEFQEGEFACRENACALTHIEEALMWMNRRAEDRAERNVLGTYEK